VTTAPLSLPVRDPARAHVAAKRQAAQKKLARVEQKGVSDMTPGRAGDLLHQIRAYLAFLARTDPVAG
jgi:hypothetical protein